MLKVYSGVLKVNYGVLEAHLGVSEVHLGVSIGVILAHFSGFWVLRGEGEYLRSGFWGFLKSAKMGGI